MPFEIVTQEIPGLALLRPMSREDGRGFFFESYRRSDLALAGADREFVQENHSGSRVAGTIRGLHFQTPPHAQDKLIRVVRGSIFDVAVDLRRQSAYFGRHIAVELSAANRLQLLVPAGFAHGFQTLEPDSEVLYMITNYYAPGAEGGLLWNDPALAIAWPIADVVINARDAALPPISELASPF